MRKLIHLAVTAALTAVSGAASAQEANALPVPCVAGVCGANIPGFVTAGRANATVTNNVLRVQQQTDRAILNWATFNVGVDGKVIFDQPNSSSIALNRIFDGSPSLIRGAIEANGQIYLINQNGFMFGPTARVRTSGLLVSSLGMAQSTFDNGLLSPDVKALEPALSAVLDPAGNPVLDDNGEPLRVAITIAPGAKISTLGKGGRVLLASQNVDNAGEIDTPDGQVILAAGEKVYLQASTDPSLRGLLVEVDAGGEAFNRLTGSISAARGNVTVVGLAVNQQGRVSATSTVSANGSIRLLARDTVRVAGSDQHPLFAATRGGQLELGSASQTTVLPELTDRTTAIDELKQLPSTVELAGRQLFVRGGAQVRAPGGEISLRAQNEKLIEEHETPFPEDSEARVRVESGAVLDVSGSDASVSVARNVVRVELRGNEFRDNPQQRDGALRGQAVYVDARVGTPLADVSGAIAGIGRAIDERTSAGGTISIKSAGDISVAQGAVFDVSGGTLTYTGGAVQTTQLLTADGRAVDIGQASATGNYTGLINPTSVHRYDRWGVTEQVQGPLIGRYEAGYTEGRSAGTLQFAARAMALDGTFRGGVTIGANQRDAARAPLGGLFIVGAPLAPIPDVSPDYFAPSINLVSRPTPTVVGDDASLPQRPLELSTDFATLGGFTRTELYSNGVVTIPESMMLVLAPGSSLRITAHRVEAGGSISAPGGSLRFASVLTTGVENSGLPRAGVNIAAQTTLDVRGLWNNDLSLLSPVYRNGGEIDLFARAPGSELVLGADVRLLANGGASLSASGAVTGGRGGNIGLRAGAGDGAFEIGSGVELSAHGVSGARGGVFSLEAPRIEIVDGAQWAVSQRVDVGSEEAGYVTLGDVLFSSFGFSGFDLIATGPNEALGENPDESRPRETLVVRRGAHIDAVARTLVLADGLASRLSGGHVDDFAQALLSPDYQRSATTVSLRTEARDFADAGRVGSLAVERDATIRVEPRGTVSLSSMGGVTIAGQITAPGGSVTATVATPPSVSDGGYREDVGITVTDSARFNLAGLTLLRPNDAGLFFGDVLAGGSLSLLANRGFIDVARGVDIDISGTSNAIDAAAAGAAGGFQRRQIASAAGSITLRSPESINFQAALHAQAGAGDTPAAGGTATFQLTRQRGFERGLEVLFPTYPTAPRTLLVTGSSAGITAGQNGTGVVDVGLLRVAGIDALNLEAGDRIEFYAGSDLDLGRSLQIAAPVVGVSGDSVSLAAPYVSFGTVVDTSTVTPVAPVPGLGRLNISGDLIELTGSTAIGGVSSATFDARRELRMRGFVNAGTSIGELRIAGDLSLRSPIIYPTTGTKFSIYASGGLNDRVTFDTPGTAVDNIPLSVGGELDVHARSIVQNTNLVAPFGRISLDATDDLQLAAGSVTSVSATGSLLPFGRIRLGEWIYQMGSTNIEAPDLGARGISLTARDVGIDAAATVDIKGGGDLYAYEWLPGTGGSVDALAPGVTPGLYAILPSLRDGFAPFDPQEYQGSDLKPGDSIYLSGGSGLAAGFYPLLPARYALLPGAMLVSAVPGTTDAAPGITTRLADGSSVVAGYRTFAGTGIRDARTSGYLVRPGTYSRQLATYQDARASTFDETARPAAPDDSARLSLAATHSFDLAGRVLAAANAKGSGAAIDLSAPDLVIRAAGSAPTANAVSVDAGILEGWKAASLLLGGHRADDGRTVDVTSERIVFGAGASLTGTEIIAVANDELRLEAGSRVSSGDAAAMLEFEDEAPLRLENEDAGAAMFGVSASRALFVERQGSADTGGTLAAAAGSTIASRGSLLLDGPEAVRADGDLTGAGASWAMGSREITIGGVAGGETSGLRIGAELLGGLAGASRLRLTASDELNIADSFGLSSLREISLDTPSIVAGAPGVEARLSADRITMLNSSQARPTSRPLATGSSLSLAAHDFMLGPGAVNVGAFELLAIAAEQEIVGQGAASLSTTGNLTLTAANIGAASDANVSISAGGLLRTANSAQALADTKRVATQLGGRVALDAARIEHGGAIRVGSGRVEIAARDSLLLESGSLLDASGSMVSAGGRSVGSSGGDLRLSSDGTLTARTGATLRVSGAGDTDAGTVGVKSAGRADFGATFVAQSADDARGGSFTADLGSLGDLNLLNRRLESGGFRERRAIHVAQGNLSLDAGESIVAREVTIATDAGTLVIAGFIDATSDNQRGRIDLRASGDLTLASTARVRALGSGALGRGGSLVLESTAGDVNLRTGSQIALGGTEEAGRFSVRAAATEDGMRVGDLDSAVTGVEVIELQPLLRYDLAGAPGGEDFSLIRDEVTAFIAGAAPALQSRFGNLATPVAVRPGIELSTDGDLFIDTTDASLFAGSQLDFSTWRFGGEAAAIAFRATGSIDIIGTISDGFRILGTGASRRLDLLADNSSSLSFDAGTDLRVNADARLRTGTGNLTLHAGNDLWFDTGASVYTGGLAGEPTHTFAGGFVLPTRGGRLELTAGHDVRGAEVTQAVGEWQVRQGRAFGTPLTPPGWGTKLLGFGWNAGTFGGGDLVVRSGNDIRDLSAAAADSASIVAGTVRRYGGGVLSFDAGNDITSAYVHVTRGDNLLRAGGEFGRSRDGGQPTLLGSVFSMQEANLDLFARRGVALESVFNPTLLSQGLASTALTTYFMSYAEDSRLRVRTATGAVDMDSTSERLSAFITEQTRGDNAASLLALLPPTVSFEATDGDIRLTGNAFLAPSDAGQLELFASRDLYSTDNSTLAMSDAPRISIPSILAQGSQEFVEVLERSDVSGRHLDDDTPALIDAGRDIYGLYLLLPKFARVNTGRDLRNATLGAQNLRDTDATIVMAGRDVVYDIDAGNKKMEIGGPGRLDIVAARNVDLGFSEGIAALGNIVNTELTSDRGANITVLAGVGSALNPADFLSRIVAPAASYRSDLQKFVAVATGTSGLDFAASVDRFGELAADMQRAFLLPVFFTELVASGRDANNIPGAGFARGYAAIDALFPGSRDPGITPRYDGDIRLAFSRIYTLADADISLLAPGGLLNVGLANPPPGLADRDPSALGIVAQRAGSVRVFTHDDVLVNQSRVFTLRGGDIAIWSTVGDIDAGRGAKSAISAPPPTVTVDASGKVTLDFAGAVAGSGIRAIITDEGVEPGDVDLIAPAGIVDAGDAGIGSAGNLNVAAQQVVGLDNIQVGGTSTGVPAETSSLGATLSGASAVASSASAAAGDTGAGDANSKSAAPLADSAFGFLDVFLEGFGSEVCKPDDTECLKRNHK